MLLERTFGLNEIQYSFRKSCILDLYIFLNRYSVQPVSYFMHHYKATAVQSNRNIKSKTR